MTEHVVNVDTPMSYPLTRVVMTDQFQESIAAYWNVLTGKVVSERPERGVNLIGIGTSGATLLGAFGPQMNIEQDLRCATTLLAKDEANSHRFEIEAATDSRYDYCNVFVDDMVSTGFTLKTAYRKFTFDGVMIFEDYHSGFLYEDRVDFLISS